MNNLLLLQIISGILIISLYVLHVIKRECYNYRWVVPILIIVAMFFGGITALRVPKELDYEGIKILIPYKNVLSIDFKLNNK